MAGRIFYIYFNINSFTSRCFSMKSSHGCRWRSEHGLNQKIWQPRVSLTNLPRHTEARKSCKRGFYWLWFLSSGEKAASEWPGFPRLSLCFRVKENSISAQSSVLTAHWRSPLSSSLMFLRQPRMRSVIITLQPRGSGFALPQRHMHFLLFWKRFLMLPVRGQRRGTAICPALILYL